MTETVTSYRETFKNMTPGEMLSLALTNHPGKVVFSTSLSAEDQIVTHMLSELMENPDIFTLDTGRLFYETYDLLDKTNKHFGINIRLVFPDSEAVERMVNQNGINLFYESVAKRKLCCNVRKIEPLKRALKGNEVWITGLRSEQSPTRNDMQFAEWDAVHHIIKINPILAWTESEVWDYIKAHNIPYNALHDQGYPSLGCKPCTRAVKAGEDIRAGRWWWEQPETKECGLHLAEK
jgi:phosphoadenosine phosphosulfate reductase